MTYELRPLTMLDGYDVYAMLQEMPKEENGFMNGAHGTDYDGFMAWLEKHERSARGLGLEENRVPQSIYWLYIDGVPVGMGKLRHTLTERLRQQGGHVGYAIRPSERGKGYGSLLLGLLVEQAGLLGLDKVLLTILNENAASIQTAKRCGGVLEKGDIGEAFHVD